MGFSNDREESFRMFQSRLLDEYEGMTEEYGLMTIDATLPISVQQQQVRRYVEPLIEDAMEAGGQNGAGGAGQRGPCPGAISRSRRAPETHRAGCSSPRNRPGIKFESLPPVSFDQAQDSGAVK